MERMKKHSLWTCQYPQREVYLEDDSHCCKACSDDTSLQHTRSAGTQSQMLCAEWLMHNHDGDSVPAGQHPPNSKHWNKEVDNDSENPDSLVRPCAERSITGQCDK